MRLSLGKGDKKRSCKDSSFKDKRKREVENNNYIKREANLSVVSPSVSPSFNVPLSNAKKVGCSEVKSPED